MRDEKAAQAMSDKHGGADAVGDRQLQRRHPVREIWCRPIGRREAPHGGISLLPTGLPVVVICPPDPRRNDEFHNSLSSIRLLPAKIYRRLPAQNG